MSIQTKLFGALSAALFCSVAGAAFAQDHSLTIALPVEPSDIDGCNTTVTNIGVIVKENIVETLSVLDPDDSTVLPRLATAWEDLGEGAWRITLAPDVTFHDGEPMNAAAVIRSIERLGSEALTCRDRTKIAGIELTATAVDDLTIDLHADPAQVLMPVLLSFIGVVSPNTPMDQLSRSPVGTGPYAFVSWDADGVKVARNAAYWGEEPAAEAATYVFRSESALRASMVEIGEADIATNIAPQDATNPELDKTFLNGETTRMRLVMLPPLDDIRIRKALNLAFDREALVGTILSADAIPATQFFLPKINGYNTDLQVWPYDPDQARALVKEAKADGVPVDTEIRLVGRTNFFPNQEEMLQVMRQMWADVGLNVKIEMMESADWLKLVNKPYPEDRTVMMVQEMHDNNNGDAAFTMHFRYHSTGQQSEMNNAEVDELIDKALVSTGEERTTAFQEANRIIAEDIIPAVPMFHMVSQMRVGPRVNYEPNSLSAIQFELSNITFK